MKKVCISFGIGLLAIVSVYVSISVSILLSQTKVTGKSTIKGLATLGSTGAGTIGFSLIGTSSTQAILSYTAPDSGACTLSVSQNFPSFVPAVNDVNESLFTGSTLDTRDGDITNGTSRI